MMAWHRTRKLWRTLRVLWQLGCARMLGEYVHSGWDGSIEYARYRWRGREWIVPTGPIESIEDEETDFYVDDDKRRIT